MEFDEFILDTITKQIYILDTTGNMIEILIINDISRCLVKEGATLASVWLLMQLQQFPAGG